MRVVSNVPRLETFLPTTDHSEIGENPSNIRLRKLPDAGFPRQVLWLIRHCVSADLVIWNGNGDRRLTLLLCYLKFLWPFYRYRLVIIDILLRPRPGWKGRLIQQLNRMAMSRVDRLLMHFRNWEGYRKHYGIPNERCEFLPFKVNDWDHIRSMPSPESDGDYVMCAGRTMRDIRTYVEAMRLVDCPGILHQQPAAMMAEHGTTAWEGELPDNLKLVIDDSICLRVFLDYVSQARLVVIPRYVTDMAPAGIATYLVAMALGKCVILSEGPGGDDVLTEGQAAIVRPQDANVLAERIGELWHDDEQRHAIAERGRLYAFSLEGEDRYLRDVIRMSLAVANKGRTKLPAQTS